MLPGNGNDIPRAAMRSGGFFRKMSLCQSFSDEKIRKVCSRPAEEALTGLQGAQLSHGVIRMKSDKQKKSDKSKKKLSTTTKALIAIAVVAAVFALIAVILLKTVFDPHRTAKNAANAAFDAVYGCNFDDFVEVTIYNADCMVDLGLALSGVLYNQIEPYFKEMETYMKDNEESYRRTSTRVEEYASGEEGFSKGISLIRGEYFDVYDGLIERVARATIEFDWSYRDENGDKQSGHDYDISWSVCVKGKWYVVPNVDESLEAQQAATNLADLAERE